MKTRFSSPILFVACLCSFFHLVAARGATLTVTNTNDNLAGSLRQAILDANPKGGKIDTLTQGFELTIPLYRTPETKDKRPFQVTDQNMTDSVNLMVEYGGLDAKAKDNPKAFYTNDYLPK